jgi:hypothetical protein
MSVWIHEELNYAQMVCRTRILGLLILTIIRCLDYPLDHTANSTAYLPVKLVLRARKLIQLKVVQLKPQRMANFQHRRVAIYNKFLTLLASKSEEAE